MYTGSTGNNNIHQSYGLGKPEWKTEIFKAETGAPDPSLKSKVVRAIAGVMTLGMSELFKKTAGYVLTNSAVITGIEDKDSRRKDFENFEHNYPQYKSYSTKLEIQTADSVKLNGMLIHPKEKQSDKYVICLNGLGGSYESNLGEAVKYANSADANILVFNYRGTGDFKNAASSARDFVTDTMAMVEYLQKEKGVNPDDIVIHGFSLGGGIGAQAAALTGTKHINDRSYEVFSKAIKSFTTDFVKEEIGETAAKCIGSATAQLMKKLDFELDVKKAIQLDAKTNPQVNKLLSRTLIISHERDTVIKEHFSLHAFVQQNDSNHDYVHIQLRNEEIADLKKFTSLVNENSELIKNIPMSTYQQYSDAGYTRQEYLDMLCKELPAKIKQLEIENPSSEKIPVLKNLINDLSRLNIFPSAHGSHLSAYTLTTTATISIFINDKGREAEKMNFAKLYFDGTDSDDDIGSIMKPRAPVDQSKKP